MCDVFVFAFVCVCDCVVCLLCVREERERKERERERVVASDPSEILGQCETVPKSIGIVFN